MTTEWLLLLLLLLVDVDGERVVGHCVFFVQKKKEKEDNGNGGEGNKVSVRF